ncbi:hypothetical protein JXJ21_13675 [candidate division KSB1 bacterium]|nr:hypothetical protein [candidate division KSB1 bacterium]
MKLNKVAKVQFALFYLVIFLRIGVAANLRQELERDIEDGRLDRFSRIEAAFILSGAERTNALDSLMQWHRLLIEDIELKRLVDPMKETQSAERLFLYLHTTWLKTYKKEATTLIDIRRKQEFNCVSATILYNLTCDEFRLDTEGFETPSHVYTIFTNFSENVMVENTTPMGFNIIKNLRAYSRYLSQYFPDKINLKIGLDRIYAYENSNGRRIDNTELLGLLCYNQAFFAADQKNYAVAYDYVLLAQKFNRNSLSNEKFEINLYYKWGHNLFRQQKFFDAFEVFADATYRYEKNEDFSRNCVSAFMNALSIGFGQKNWEQSEKIIFEMGQLELLNSKELNIQRNIVLEWLNYYLKSKNKHLAYRVFKTFEQHYKSDRAYSSIKELIEGLK